MYRIRQDEDWEALQKALKESIAHSTETNDQQSQEDRELEEEHSVE